MALCEAHNHQFGSHNAALKTYIWLTSSYYWPRIYSDILRHTKTFNAVNKENLPQTSHHCCNRCQRPTNPTSASTRTSLAPCWLPDISTNTFCASQMPSRNTHLSQRLKTRKRKLWPRPFFPNGFVNSASQRRFTPMVGKSC